MNDGDKINGEIRVDDLTWREQEVLMLLAQRQTNREIADQLHLAESTVKDYVGKILSKLYVKNRREAVERAESLGILDFELETTSVPPIKLPVETTPFIGRKNELIEIRRYLGETRLLTLIGPGGIGKSRLAVKAAEGVVEQFKDGVFFVSLAPINSAERIVQTIAEAVNFPLSTDEDPQYQLLRYLQKKQLLLVVDNYEHLLEGVGVVSEILNSAPGVKVLATSREKLDLQGETILNIVGMDVPEDVDQVDSQDFDAVALFTQHARMVRSGYDLSPNEVRQTTIICQMLQGLPLAIEIAAAWLQILSLDEIIDELRKGLDILRTDVRDIPERHRSIRVVFDHSWSLLEKKEREIFMSLSVFRGGFTRQAAEQVARASLVRLSGLVKKSFLRYVPDSSRFEVHELLRQYAQERLEQIPRAKADIREAHAAYFAEFMQARWQQLKGKKQMEAFAEIEADMENVRAAWRYYLDRSNSQQMFLFINSLWQVYWIRGWNLAGIELFREAAEVLHTKRDENSLAVRALANALQGYFGAWLGQAAQGFRLTKESVSVLEKLNYPEALVLAYDSLGVNAYFIQRYEEEYQATKRMIEIAQKVGDDWLIALSLFAESMSAFLRADYPEAKRLAEENLRINREVGDLISSNMSIIILGHVALATGEYDKANGFYLRCLRMSEKIGFYYGVQTTTKYLGKVNLTMGNLAEAKKHLLHCLVITNEIGFVRDIVNLCYEFARLNAVEGDVEKAVELLAFVLQHPASYQSRLLEGRIRDDAKNLLSSLEAELSQEIFASALQRGQEAQLDQLVYDLQDQRSN